MSKILVVWDNGVTLDETQVMCYNVLDKIKSQLPSWIITNVTEQQLCHPDVVKAVLQDILLADAEGVSPIVITNVPKQAIWEYAFRVIGATNIDSGVGISSYV